MIDDMRLLQSLGNTLLIGRKMCVLAVAEMT